VGGGDHPESSVSKHVVQETGISRPIIDFYLDFISPFGYLARHRLSQIVTDHACVIRYHPIDLTKIKLAAGNNGPSNRNIPPKIRYLTTDLQRWARRYEIPMVETLAGPATEKMNKGLLWAIDLRVADEYVRQAWDCVWRHGRDPGDIRTLENLATSMGWRADDFIAFVDSEPAAQRYEAENQQAIGIGVFGVPTFLIDGEMFWGNDRLDFLEEYLAARENRARA
jgi:2-hydroxychromene-2-carboxylate isomerase